MGGGAIRPRVDEVIRYCVVQDKHLTCRSGGRASSARWPASFYVWAVPPSDEPVTMWRSATEGGPGSDNLRMGFGFERVGAGLRAGLVEEIR